MHILSSSNDVSNDSKFQLLAYLTHSLLLALIGTELADSRAQLGILGLLSCCLTTDLALYITAAYSHTHFVDSLHCT